MFFGAGFFIGPTLVCLAAIVRGFEWAGVDTTQWVRVLRGSTTTTKYVAIPNQTDNTDNTNDADSSDATETGSSAIPPLFLKL